MSMCKRVNVNAPIAVRTITPPIFGSCNNIIMSTGDILKCLCKRATVEEILPDGTKVRLNMSNYYTDNGAGLDARVSNPINIVVQNNDPVNTNALGDSSHVEKDDASSNTEDTNNTPESDNNSSTENEPAVTSGFINTNSEDDESNEYKTTTSVTNEDEILTAEVEDKEPAATESEDSNNVDKEESDDNSVNEETDTPKDSDDSSNNIDKKESDDNSVNEDDSVPEKEEAPKKTSNSTNKKKSNNSSKKKSNTSK